MKTKPLTLAALVLTFTAATVPLAQAASSADQQIIDRQSVEARQEAEKKTAQIVAARNIPPIPVENQTGPSPVVELPVDETDSPAASRPPGD